MDELRHGLIFPNFFGDMRVVDEPFKRGPGRPPSIREPGNDEPIEEAQERLIVARGTVIKPDPKITKVIGEGADGKPKRSPAQVHYKIGDEIELPPDEARRLIELGVAQKPGQPLRVPAALFEGSQVVELGAPIATPRG